MINLRLIVVWVFISSFFVASCSIAPFVQNAQSITRFPQTVQARNHHKLIPPIVYVANNGSGLITAYDANDKGDVAPDIRIQSDSSGLAVDSIGRLYTFFPSGGSPVYVYAPGATGNVAPIATIGCGGSFQGYSLAIGPRGDEDVVAGQLLDTPGQSISWVEQGARGCARVHVIEGPDTDVNAPVSLAIDRHGLIYAAEQAADFGVTGITVHRRDASGDSRPLRFISGSTTTLLNGSLQGVAVDDDGLIYALVSNGNTGFISIFDDDANANTPPLRILRGLPSAPQAIALDHHGIMYITFSNNSIIMYDSHAAVLTPIRTIAGPHTMIDSPWGSAGIAVYDPR